MAGYMEDNLDMPLGMLLPIMQDSIINQTKYFGVRTWKGPIDAWLYQEIIFETKPDVIIEIGNAFGDQIVGDLVLDRAGEDSFGGGDSGLGGGGADIGECLRFRLGDLVFRHLGAASDELLELGRGLGSETFGLEYRMGRLLWWRLRPFAGAGITTQHSFYGYGGIRLATYWGEHIVATPSFAVGGYSRGAGKDLGNPPIVGRFGVDLGYRFQNDLLVGLAYHHISNGKLLGQITNPGTEIVALTVSMPVR